GVHARAQAPRREEQLELRSDVALACDVDRGEENASELGRIEILFQLAHLVVEIGERALDVGVFEPAGEGPLLKLACVAQRRERLRDVVEDAFASLLLPLDLLPVPAHSAGTIGDYVVEDVRMTSHKLRVHIPCHGFEISLVFFLERQRQENDLEEQIAELVEQLRVVLGQRCIRDFIRLLDRVRHDRARGLLAVPRAIAAQPLGQLLQLEKGLCQARQISRWWRSSQSSSRTAYSRLRRRPSWRNPSSPGRPRRSSHCSSSSEGACSQ